MSKASSRAEAALQRELACSEQAARDIAKAALALAARFATLRDRYHIDYVLESRFFADKHPLPFKPNLGQRLTGSGLSTKARQMWKAYEAIHETNDTLDLALDAFDFDWPTDTDMLTVILRALDEGGKLLQAQKTAEGRIVYDAIQADRELRQALHQRKILKQDD